MGWYQYSFTPSPPVWPGDKTSISSALNLGVAILLQLGDLFCNSVGVLQQSGAEQAPQNGTFTTYSLRHSVMFTFCIYCFCTSESKDPQVTTQGNESV